MNLEAQINRITNPQTFTDICNTVFTSKHGDEYQVVDGSRGDGGNDGYIKSERTMLAMHCPVKPQNRTDADIIRKIKSDFAKAVNLKTEGIFEIEKWRFVTTNKLSNNILEVILELGKEFNVNTGYLEANFLSDELYKNQHLLQKIPELHVTSIDQKLSALIKELNESRGITPDSSSKNKFVVVPKKIEAESDEYEEVVSLIRGVSTQENKAKLRVLYYASKDYTVKLNALIGLVESFNPATDDMQNFLNLCDDGIELSEKSGYNDGVAFFMAKKGYFLSFRFTSEFTTLYFSMQMDSKIGIPLTPNIPERVNEISRLEEQLRLYLNKSIDLAFQSNDYAIPPTILINNGNAAGLRSIAYIASNDHVNAEILKSICKKCFMTAKEIYDANDDDVGVSNVMFNLANQIRFFGETAEAKLILESIKPTIMATGTGDLKTKFGKLEQALQSGEYQLPI